jgi:hypothetical protein
MRYTAIAAILLGIAVACYAGFHYASAGPPEAESPSAASLAVPLAFAALLMIGGIVMWVFVGKGYIASKGSFVQPRTGNRGSGSHPDKA